MLLENIVIDTVSVRDRLRPVDAAKVVRLAGSIEEVGLLSPIILHAPEPDILNLVAGAHRLEAAKRLGWETVDAYIMEGDELHAQLAEIDENLIRSELTATQYSEHMQRRKEIWEAMQNQVESVVPPENDVGYGRPPEQCKKFATETADATGQTRQHVNRATKRAREVCQQARDLIRGTKADTGTFLDQLSKLDGDQAQIDAGNDKLEALNDEQKARELREEQKAREQAAQEARERSRSEVEDKRLAELQRLYVLLNDAGRAQFIEWAKSAI